MIFQNQIMKKSKNFSKSKNEPYSINRIEDIIEKIETITINEYERLKQVLKKILTQIRLI